MFDGQAYELARRVGTTPGWRVIDVRRAWSSAWAWQVEAVDERTGERALLLSDDQWENDLAYAAEGEAASFARSDASPFVPVNHNHPL